jgi:hypothetical protein
MVLAVRPTCRNNELPFLAILEAADHTLPAHICAVLPTLGPLAHHGLDEAIVATIHVQEGSINIVGASVRVEEPLRAEFLVRLHGAPVGVGGRDVARAEVAIRPAVVWLIHLPETDPRVELGIVMGLTMGREIPVAVAPPVPGTGVVGEGLGCANQAVFLDDFTLSIEGIVPIA